MPRATGLENGDYDGSKPQPPTWCGVGEQKPRPTAWGGARCEFAAQTTAPSTQRVVRALWWAVGWFSTGRRARATRATGLERDGYNGSKPHPPTWCGVGDQEPRPTAWGGTRRELAAQTTAPSPAARSACSVGGQLVLHVTKRARAARHGTRMGRLRRVEAAPPTWCGVGEQEPPPTAWGVARRGEHEHTPTHPTFGRIWQIGHRVPTS